MSKRQFDHIIERIKEAAIKNEPLFEAYAWEKMEKKLNDENSKKRYFFKWFVFGVFLLLTMCIPKLVYENKAPKFIKSAQELVIKKVVDYSNQLQQSSINLTSNKLFENRKSSNYFKEKSFNSFEKKFYKYKLKDSSFFFLKKIAVHKGENSIHDLGGLYDQDTANSSLKNYNLFRKLIVSPLLTEGITYEPKKSIPDNFLLSNNKFISSVIEDHHVINNVKQKGKRFSRFYFIGSVGVDFASVKIFSFKNSVAVPKYGAGIGFQINKNISIQTGFYNSRKKYIAGPQDYKVIKGSYWDMVQLTEIDAACLIYEIPFTMRFNFLKKPSYNLYASTGLSSFIMKKEDYNYYYIRYNTPHESAWSYTGNKNLFSILTLNMGIEKKISTNFSLLVEPSVSIPLAGIGEGKVKLFSTSFQAGLKYQPLKKNKK